MSVSIQFFVLLRRKNIRVKILEQPEELQITVWWSAFLFVNECLS